MVYGWPHIFRETQREVACSVIFPFRSPVPLCCEDVDQETHRDFQEGPVAKLLLP